MENFFSPKSWTREDLLQCAALCNNRQSEAPLAMGSGADKYKDKDNNKHKHIEKYEATTSKGPTWGGFWLRTAV